MRKLTRKQIAEGLEAMPIENILLGANSKTKVTLTAKQKAFAEEVAKGTPKAKAYRKAYNSKGKPTTQAQEGSKTAKLPHVSAMIESIMQANEAMKYQTPAHLRTLTIHELTKHALSEDNPPAQRIKALELLGKITEVALFTERREVIKVESPEVMREKLINSIKLAIGNTQTIDAEYSEADDLLAEIAQANDAAHDVDDDAQADYDGLDTEPAASQSHEDQEGEANANGTSATPPAPHPQIKEYSPTDPMHSIPLTQSSSISASSDLLQNMRDDDEVSL